MRPLDWLGLTLLLLFAAGLRIIGISYGQLKADYFPSYAPYGMVHEQLPIQPDELFNVAIPVEMALKNRLNPEFFNYPAFIINSNFVMLHLTGALEGLSFDDRAGKSQRTYAAFPLYVLARMYSVFGSLLTVACAYAIPRMLGGRYAAFCAALLVAVSYTLVQHSNYIKPASLATGWMMLATWASIAALHTRRARSRERLYIFAGIFTGLAATTRYNAVAVAIIVCLAGLALLYRQPSRRNLRLIALSWLLIPLVFILISPYTLRDFEHFWQEFTNIVAQYQVPGQVADYFLVSHETGMLYLLIYISLFSLGIPAMAALLPAFIAAWQGRKPQPHRHNALLIYVILITLFLLAYILVVFRTIRPGHTDHMLLPSLPYFALLSAIGADWLVKRIPLPKRFMMPAIALVLVIQPLVLSLHVVWMFRQPDTRHIMLDWIHENIPRGSRFFLNGPYNVPLDEALYPNVPQYGNYVAELPSGADYDYMIYSDALAFDILRSEMIVPPAIRQGQRDYLQRLDASYQRLAHIERPTWLGSETMMNMASYWHNPGLILYCLNPASCATLR